ncbi:uncharacterized protein BT62DRAFT_930182 [Guyanagaster necrorhizus]|uniref:Uncharacterized protein n=1 Tax=Guyanagaster necrorhizus TaxID=856835 RepID=A0A9P8AU46_9AGAR|nr:uncharacterized protein BT62DRAFT_930182 [Guyanagaster necrorhizus MCA 3950]KAG7448098.1 hypothetical protein BT62DRAFT_930182 [Guyanagaster necrorhizus MCA 3950]
MILPQEALCLHPVVYGPFLQPAEDDILPLSNSIKTMHQSQDTTGTAISFARSRYDIVPE